MISLKAGDAVIDILPVVRGLPEYGKAVRDAFGKYDIYAASLSPEEIEGVRNRTELMDGYEPGELEAVFAKRLSEFGEISVPAPAWCELVDLCDSNSKTLSALDMPDREYTELYCQSVSSMEFVREHRLAKKGMKKKFDMSSPESFAVDWDRHVNAVRGFRELSGLRERYISLRLSDISKKGGRALAVIDHERVAGIVRLMGDE
ncbi:MAG: hypothetical protein PHV81_05010 [Candidatus Methanomethylophilaceae archaeon]|jgi:hypothetical protein|nr:hypothetical protein [Candidatus Methanomethylophilaceae archaeon]MDD2936332.1 hypothetical protein [Candidatus Methanomethylophilaceae archaeon]MDD3351297.1 hypothetical protein [Candidatus Methanomethylophilaceae archaeon]MDD3987022.1 hypothetical protein [Candidatus Methanomethylophilaceae archaeon]MDY0252078.1 hypothetical protein [Candidatus Methanomethylophilaceae archaeon]